MTGKEERALVRAAKTCPVAAGALADGLEERGESGRHVERRRLFSQWFPLVFAALQPKGCGYWQNVALPDGARFRVKVCPKVHFADVATAGRPFGFGSHFRRERCAEPAYVARKVYEWVDSVLPRP